MIKRNSYQTVRSLIKNIGGFLVLTYVFFTFITWSNQEVTFKNIMTGIVFLSFAVLIVAIFFLVDERIAQRRVRWVFQEILQEMQQSEHTGPWGAKNLFYGSELSYRAGVHWKFAHHFLEQLIQEGKIKNRGPMAQGEDEEVYEVLSNHKT